jgi:hypothetical protein
MIKSLNGTVVYTTKKEQKSKAKKDKGMKKPTSFPIQQASGEPAYYAGLRRSSYGLPKRNWADDWWAVRAKEFAADLAANINGGKYVQPVIIEIVSGYRNDGETIIEFLKPKSYSGSTKGMAFVSNRGINH